MIIVKHTYFTNMLSKGHCQIHLTVSSSWFLGHEGPNRFLPSIFIALSIQTHECHTLLKTFVVLHKGLDRQLSPELIGLCDYSLL